MAKDSVEKKESNTEEKGKLTLEDIKVFGGDKDDLKLIADLDDDDEELKFDEESDQDDNLTKLELRQFVEKLGFKKLDSRLVVLNSDDEDGETESVPKKETAVDKTREKKVKGNKFKPHKDSGSVKESEDQVTVKVCNPALLGPPTSLKVRDSMLVKPTRKWYESEIALNCGSPEKIDVSAEKLLELEKYAKQLLDHDVKLYKKYQATAKNRSNFHWIQTVQRSGTTADKMAAYTVLLQDSCVHNLATLESLICLVDVKHKTECLMAVDTLKELFLGDLLLENKKLNTFDKQPFGLLCLLAKENQDSYDKLLLLWYFEACLKRRYNQLVVALSKMCRDSVEATKRKALRTMFELLANSPEQEQLLLTHVVNKIGDPHQKIASLCCQLLCRLVDKHPNMKGVVVAEVEKLIFRQNLAQKALYYAICFLNQLILDHEDKVLAAKLISIYFALFKAATKKGEVESKMMSALLTGVNRAFPYAKLEMESLENQIDNIYKIVHTSNFNISIQALMLLYQVLGSKDEFSDRFYCALYRKLLDSQLKHSSKQAMFLNLLYKTLKREQVLQRINAFVKRILQISSEQSPGMICGLLYLVSEITLGASRQPILQRQMTNPEADDGDDERFEDISDNDSEGQVDGSPVDERTDSNNIILRTNAEDNPPAVPCQSIKSSWDHRTNLNGYRKPVYGNLSRGAYDPFARNPTFAGADRTCIWELVELSNHFHPSVALFASTLLSGKRISYTGDPLQDFTLSRFLDRFVYRNPKKVSANSSASSQRAILGKRKSYNAVGARAFRVNSEVYRAKPQAEIPIEERFFHKFFANQKVLREKQMMDDDEDVESVQSDEFDQILDQFEPGSCKEEFDLDFASEFKEQRNAKKAVKKKQEEDESDEDVDFGADQEFADAFKDFDEDIEAATAGNRNWKDADESDEEMEFSDDDDLDDDDVNSVEGSSGDDEEEMKAFHRKPKRSKEFDPSQLFASAEEFSAALDENTTANGNMIGLEALANRDNAHVKQLRWEQDRDRWVRGADWKSIKKRKAKAQPKGKQWKSGRPNSKSDIAKRAKTSKV